MKALVIALCVLAAAPPWQRVAEDAGVVVDVQPVEGSPFERVRVRGTSTADVETFARVWWGRADDVTRDPTLASREVLLDQSDERIVYDIINVPLGSARNAVLRSVKLRDGRGGITVHVDSVDDKRHPASASKVRIRATAVLSLTPTATGGSAFEYTSFADIGGSIPAFLLAGPQRSGTLAFAKDVRQRAEANTPAR